jgi:uroporphyrinogen decarboxylase
MATAAARYMQVPVRQMFSDPTTLANPLQSCQRLFKYDAIVVLFDTTLEAEACGCGLEWEEDGPPRVVAPAFTSLEDAELLNASDVVKNGRIPAVLEAASRLAQTAGRDIALFGAVTGPVTLGRHLTGEDLVAHAAAESQAFQRLVDYSGKIAVALARAFGELGFDAVIVADRELAALNSDRYASVQPVLRTMSNVLGFYDAGLILQTGTVPSGNLEKLFELPADGFSLGNPVSDLTGTSLPAGKFLGGCIPASALLGSDEDIHTAVSDLVSVGGKIGFVSTEGEVPSATPASNLHRVVQVLNPTG